MTLIALAAHYGFGLVNAREDARARTPSTASRPKSVSRLESERLPDAAVHRSD